jgi:hypothetical protein
MAKEWTFRERWGSARKKVWEAVNVLVGDGAMSTRLGYAYGLLAQLQSDQELPERLRPRFRKLMKDLGDRADEGTHRPVRIITRAPKSGMLASEILSIYIELNDGI